MKPRVRWEWVAKGAACITVRFEHLKLKFTLKRDTFGSSWEIEAWRGDDRLPGLNGRRRLKHCCNIMRSEHGKAILRRYAGLEV